MSPVKPNVAGSPAGSVIFLTVIVARFVFVYVQVTCWPAVTTNVATPLAVTPLELPLSQLMLVRFQPVFAASVTWYVPGTTDESADWPSPRVAVMSPVKPNVAGSPDGSVTFLTVIVARFVFVYVQVTCWPAATTKVETPVAV